MFLLVRHELKTQVSSSLAGGDHLFFDLMWPLAAVGISVLLSEAQSAAPVAWPSGNMAHSQGGDMELLSLGQVRGWPHALGVAGIGQNLIQGSGAGPGCQSVSLVEAAVQL